MIDWREIRFYCRKSSDDYEFFQSIKTLKSHRTLYCSGDEVKLYP